MEEAEPGQVEEDPADLVGQEDLEVDVEEFVQLEKVEGALRVQLVPEICPLQEGHLENGPSLCYLEEKLPVNHLLGDQLFLHQTSGLTV